MASLLEALGRVSFFQGFNCPYELLLAIYHIALPFEKFITNERRSLGANRFGKYASGIDFDAEGDVFNIDADLANLARMASNDRQAALLVFELLTSLDLYLSGADSNQSRESGATAIPSRLLDRFANPFYYSSLEVTIGGEKVTYMIIPKRQPLYAKWITMPLPRDEGYFRDTLATHCLNNHRILRDGRIGNQPVSFPVNGADAQKYSSFLQSLEPLKKLVVALAPYDAGFVPELVTYDKNHEDRIPFRYVRMNKPSRKMVAEKLRAVLTSARDRGVDILIFPELTVDHDALTEIHNFLSLHNSPEQLKLVIAGSFHRERNQGGGYTNSATMLDWQGNDIWRHHKLHPYMLRTAEIPENSKRTALLKLFGAESGDDAEEHIRTDYPLSFVDTPIGRMATLICLDYLASQVCETVGGVGCHYLWVPLMTTSIDTFNTHARDEYGAKYHVLSAFSASVSCPEMFGVRKEDFSFLYAPSRRFGKSGEHPDVIRSEEPPLILYQLEIML